MNIFGLGYDGFHDSNVSVMNNEGGVLFAINEERLSKVKKDGRFPQKSIMAANPSYDEVLCISNLEDTEFKAAYNRANKTIDKTIVKERAKVFRHINKFKEKFKRVYFFSHHECHAASAYHFSGFSEALVLTWDAGNNSEPWNMTISLGEKNHLERVEESLDGKPCLDYTAITAIMGFLPTRHEGKVTGLSARGHSTEAERNRLLEIICRHRKSHDSLIGRIAEWRNVGDRNKVPFMKLNKSLIKHIGQEINLPRENLAHAIQKISEDIVLKKIDEANKKYEAKNICLAGGIISNVIINKKIKELGFEKVFIHPAMGDDGLSLGACARYLGLNGIRPKKLKHVFFGQSFSNQHVKNVLERSNLRYVRFSNIEEKAAQLLSRGKIVARFSGKMEYGPRSLGNRSILCQAIDIQINDSLNKKLRRSEFMPFAPISLEEDLEKLYKAKQQSILPLKFMTIAVDCHEKIIKESPAIVHVDKTARPQIIGDENLGLKKILKAYKDLTGISSLINTSFNMHESPIVCKPEDAILAFQQSSIDYLLIGNYAVSSKSNLKIGVLIPAYNEEKTIKKVIEGAKKYTNNVIVVVDGSTDKTEEIVRGENVSIIINHKNLGLTKSIKNGFQYALKNGYDAIVKLDADEQMNSNSYKKMMDQYQASKDDIIYATNNSDTPWMIKKDIWIYTSLFNLASKQKNVDIISEYRLFSRKAMKTYLESKLRDNASNLSIISLFRNGCSFRSIGFGVDYSMAHTRPFHIKGLIDLRVCFILELWKITGWRAKIVTLISIPILGALLVFNLILGFKYNSLLPKFLLRR